MFKFYLNNTLVTDPYNWADFTETIERDADIKGLLPKYDIKLNFGSDGYNLLYDLLSLNGYCTLVELKVDMKCAGSYVTVLNGYIFISDCKFNLNRCEVECGVTDNNYGAKIYNNKNIKAYLNIGRSKNDSTITPCAYESIQFFTPSTGVHSGTGRYCYLISDAFRFLIDFMSDGAIGFESTYLTTATAAPNVGVAELRITTGNEIRTAAHTGHPFTSFEELFKEVDKKYPLGFTIINVGGVPTIKIEDAAYFYNATNSISINNINDLKQSFNNELLYSSVKFGGEALEKDVSHSYEQIRFFNFINEEYHLQGQCNIDKILDLTALFISDSNIIEGLFATDTSNTTYDKDIVFVEAIANTTAMAYNNPLTGTIPYYYNDGLKNNKVAERLTLQGNIALYLGNNDDLFLASNTANQSIVAVGPIFTNPITPQQTDVYYAYLDFQDDFTSPNFDTNGRYNITNNRYTSPANGVYTFEILLKSSNYFDSFTSAQITLSATIELEVYDSGSVRKAFYDPTPITFTVTMNDGQTYIASDLYNFVNIYLISGYYIIPKLTITATMLNTINFQPGDSYEYTTTVSPTSTFECTQSVNGGGVYQVENPSAYYVSKFEFEKSLSNNEYNLLKADLSKSIIISNNSNNFSKKTWIRKTTRNLSTGEMNWELISNLES